MNSQMSFFEATAKPLIERGVPVIPLSPKTKIAFLPNWEMLATTDPNQVHSWGVQYPNANTASVAFAKPDGVWFLDIDRKDYQQEIEKQTGQKIPKTFQVRSSTGRGHYYWKQTPASIQMGNCQGKDEQGETFSARVDNRYVVSPNSVHPETGLPYQVLRDAPIVEAPDWLIEFCSKSRTGDKKTATTPVDDNAPIITGSRNNTITSLLGKARQNLGMDRDQLLDFALSLNQKRCVPPLSDNEIKTVAYSVARYDVVPTGPETVIMGQTDADKKVQEAAAEEQQEQWNKEAEAYRIAYEEGVPSHTYYAMTAEEFELEKQKEFPVFPLKISSGPKWSNDILYGDAGKLVLKASEYNESHPAGMLVDFLVSLGSIIGRSPHFAVGDTMHYTNEFFIRVGDTARSRKGTGRDAMDAILRHVDPAWYSSRIENGFGSGEAIIGRIRDSFEQVIRQRDNTFKGLIVPGIDDKRLCIREGEAASILVLASKPDSRADIILRDGWDGKVLRNVVKGNSRDGINSSAKCENPHLSISADTTISELRAKMPSGAEANGFGNRFLYVYASRVKDCPQGAPPLDWSAEMLNFQEVVKFAKTVGRMPKSQTARDWWSDNYTRIEHDVLPGLAGLMTARASAHIARLAMIYALIDFSDVIERDHFLAAKRLWDYCADSALLIFGGITKEQAHISSWIELHHGATYKQIRDNLYHRNRPVPEIKADLDALVSRGVIRLVDEAYVKP